jgi:hypothetical protein
VVGKVGVEMKSMEAEEGRSHHEKKGLDYPDVFSGA